MKVFKSLNCIVCEAPFASSERQPRSPMVLYCGKMICQECSRRERSTNKAYRKHQCEFGDQCFQKLESAYNLLVVLSQDALKLSPKGDGYFLCKLFNCPICHDAYSNTLEGKSPILLWDCKHIICTSCSKENLRLDEGPNKDLDKYIFKCPICSVDTAIEDYEWTVRGQVLSYPEIKDFLAELTEITRELEETCRFCEECKKEQPIEDMFFCEECEKNICASCGFKKHRYHKTLVTLEKQTTKMVNQLQNLFKTYQNLFPEMHKELIDDIGTFGTKVLSKEENLKLASNYGDLRKLNTKFETISKKYVTNLLEYDTEVKDLIKSLDKDTN